MTASMGKKRSLKKEGEIYLLIAPCYPALFLCMGSKNMGKVGKVLIFSSRIGEARRIGVPLRCIWSRILSDTRRFGRNRMGIRHPRLVTEEGPIVDEH